MGLTYPIVERSPALPRPSAPRNIAVFIDGTWNEAHPRRPTNVRKLFEAMRGAGSDAAPPARDQFALYLSGVGTKPRVNARGAAVMDEAAALDVHLRNEMPASWSRFHKWAAGGAAGKGTRARIKAAYDFLCRYFDRARGDQVFIFGFSRGAFAARSLAGFVGHVGLLLKSHPDDVALAWTLYEKSRDAAQAELGRFMQRLTGRARANAEGDVLPVHFLGVWDTVASLGMPSRLAWFGAPFTEYRQLDVPPTVMTARHALALHELRPDFEPLLWCAGDHPDVKQVWFAGAHSDVGGGQELGEDALSDTALRWMASEAKDLELDDHRPWRTQWEIAPRLHNAVRGIHLLGGAHPRRWLADRTYENAWQSHHVHRSAAEHLLRVRHEDYSFRLPQINRALRMADDLAVQMLVYLRLNGQEIEDDQRWQ